MVDHFLVTVRYLSARKSSFNAMTSTQCSADTTSAAWSNQTQQLWSNPRFSCIQLYRYDPQKRMIVNGVSMVALQLLWKVCQLPGRSRSRVSHNRSPIKIEADLLHNPKWQQTDKNWTQNHFRKLLWLYGGVATSNSNQRQIVLPAVSTAHQSQLLHFTCTVQYFSYICNLNQPQTGMDIVVSPSNSFLAIIL